MSVSIIDRRPGLQTPGALVELTEADLRELARMTDAEAKRLADDARTPDDRLYARLVLGNSRRFERIANELRKANNQNGAGTAGTAPRQDQEAVTP